MKAPETIYLPGELNFVTATILNHKKEKDDIEYIRKDLVDEKIKTAEETIELAEDHAYFAGKEKLREELLKWLEEMKFYADDNRKIAYQNVIDKLHKL